MPTTPTTPCTHTPPCPTADSPDREAAQTVAGHPEQGWSLLCNGVLLFEDTGELLPGGQIIAPHRPTDAATTASDDLFVRYMQAFQAATEHVGACPACQADLYGDTLCADGAAIHGRFTALQDQYEARKHAGLAAA